VITHQQKFRLKPLVLLGVFIASFVIFAIVLGTLGWSGWWSLPLVALPSFVLTFVLWPDVWGPVEYSPKAIRVHQAISVITYLLFVGAMFAVHAL
jgi:hypothetical protein